MDITFYGNFGVSSWGNESTLLAMISRVRALDPDARLRCVCTSPDVAHKRLGIETIPFATNAARLWNRELPLARRMTSACSRLMAELCEYAHAFRALRGTEVLLVPGTGVVTDAAGLHGYGPYTMFKWVLVARLRGAKVRFVSVGAGPLSGVAGRVLVRLSLSLASYRSYRDAESRDVLQDIGLNVARDPLFPDLSFSLPKATLPVNHRTTPRHRGSAPSGDGRRIVGLGLMVYSSQYSGSDPTEDTYSLYLAAMAVFTRWLLDHDYDVRLLLGDDDTEAITDFRSTLSALSGTDDDERIIYEPFTSVQDVLEAIAETDLVVATRFHNVAFAMILEKPVIAISFHQKCASLMSGMQLDRYCHDIHHMDAARLIEQFESLERDEDAVKHTIAQGVRDARAALDEQYAAVFPAFH